RVAPKLAPQDAPACGLPRTCSLREERRAAISTSTEYLGVGGGVNSSCSTSSSLSLVVSQDFIDSTNRARERDNFLASSTASSGFLSSNLPSVRSNPLSAPTTSIKPGICSFEDSPPILESPDFLTDSVAGVLLDDDDDNVEKASCVVLGEQEDLDDLDREDVAEIEMKVCAV
ncbi:unnamed protein product, partial [Amoebophrya sp. A25]